MEAAVDQAGQPQQQSSSDERLLDEVFDRALEQVEQGRSIDIEMLVHGRSDLLSEARRLVRLAREVAVVRCEPRPTLAGYTILSELGHGGMGTVYLARQERLGGRPVAMKVLPQSAALSSLARERFLNEARAIAKLQHPNIVAIHDVVEDGHTLAYAMDRVDGGSLAEMIVDHATLEPPTACRIGIAIARALGEVHRAGLVHRDVKPSNILIRQDGVPLLTDFGLVRETDTPAHTQAGRFVGTAVYAAPEQLRGETNAVDARCDVYALGATLYHALAGRLLVAADSTAEVLRRVEAGLVEPLREANPRLPRDLQTIVHKAIDPDPAHRYQSADELADDLERLLNLQPIRARPAGPITRTTKLLRRNRRVLTGATIGAVLVLLMALGAALYTLWLPHQIDANVRAAQLALLNPRQGERIFEVVIEVSPYETPAFTTEVPLVALQSYERYSLHRFFPPELRFEYETVTLALALTGPPTASLEVPELIRREAQLTDRYALDWFAGRHTPPVPSDSDLQSATDLDLRSLGLLAFMCNDAATSVAAWSRLDLVESSDPLVEASLGQLYLAMERPELAYPHAMMAFRHFNDAGFLCLNVADAAIQMGGDELNRGRRMLDRAEKLGMHDKSFTLQRVRADYHAAIGEDALAEVGYLFFIRDRQAPTAFDHYANFLIDRGRLREAVEVYADLVRLRGWVPKYRQRYLATADAWWVSLGPEARLAEIHPAVAGRGILLDTLRTYQEVATNDPASSEPRGPIPPEFTTLPGLASAPFIQRANLRMLAQRMEVSDMNRWSQISRYPQWLKSLQLSAWLCDDGGAGSRAIGVMFAVWLALPPVLFGPVAQAQFIPCIVDSHQKISDSEGGFGGTLDSGDLFGHTVALLGDLNGDGVNDIAVGTRGDDDGGTDRGAVWILFMNPDGTVQAEQKISDVEGGFSGILDDFDSFGFGVAGLGDLNGDGFEDLAVGAYRDDDGGANANADRGAVWILFLRANGTVDSHQKISDTEGGFGGLLQDGDGFGSAIAAIGDLANDGLAEIAVGAWKDDSGATDAGAMWILTLNSNGTVRSHVEISCTSGLRPCPLGAGGSFGIAASCIGDLDADGNVDLAVGAAHDDDGGESTGAIYILFLNSDGTVESYQKVSANEGDFPGPLHPVDEFGESVAGLGDVDGDGINDLAVGAPQDDDGGTDHGAVWILFLNSNGTVKAFQKISDLLGGFSGILDDGDQFGISVASLGNLDDTGLTDLAVGAALDDDGGTDRGAVWMLFLDDACPNDCSGDCNESVGITDLLALLGQWGGPGGCDFDPDGVGITDLLELLANWGPCPPP